MLSNVLSVNKIYVTNMGGIIRVFLTLILALAFFTTLLGDQPLVAAERLVPIYQPRTSPVARPNQYLYGCRVNCPPSVRSLKRSKSANRIGSAGKSTCVGGNCGQIRDKTRLLPATSFSISEPRDRLAETRPMPACAPEFQYDPATLRCRPRAK